MINGKFVIDAVTHAFDARPELRDASPGYRYGWMVHESTFGFQWAALPDPYRLTREQFFQRMTSEALESALFLESPTDLAWFHTIPAWGIWPDISPISVGMEVRERHPDRMFLYGAVSPLEGTKALEDLERQVEEWGVSAVKLYPVDFVDGKLRPWHMSEEKVLYPVLEKCRELGVKVVAVHKSLPVGHAPMEFFNPHDVDYPAADFPDLNFEVVHGGFTFLEETAFQFSRFDNIYVNLEATCWLILRHPAKFAQILGEILLWGGGKRVVWGTGAAACHPAPLIEAFDSFQIPDDVVAAYGYPVITEEDRVDIFAGNFARMHGLDLEALKSKVADDAVATSREAGLAEPWSGLRVALAG
jgi:predicted TIM-barrel fold metal-dependent hydrolase